LDALQLAQFHVLLAFLVLRGCDRPGVLAGLCWNDHLARVEDAAAGGGAAPQGSAWRLTAGEQAVHRRPSPPGPLQRS
jgi:hypothetical protein